MALETLTWHLTCRRSRVCSHTGRFSILLIPDAIDFGLDGYTGRVDEIFIAIDVDFDMNVYVDLVIAIRDGIVDVDVYSDGGGR